METHAITGLVTIFASIFTFYLAFNVGMTRMKHKVQPYHKTENEAVIVANRVHMNTVEGMVVFLPLLWVASIFGNPVVAGSIGSVWFVSRIWYAFAYLKNPASRQIPFMLGFICIALAAILGMYGLLF